LPTYPFERKRFWLDAEVRRPVSEGSRTPEPVSSSPPRSNPQVDAERLIAGIWSRLLGVEHVDVNDNFFDLGGHSLLVATAVAEIRKQTGVKLTPSRFAFETMGQLAASVAAEPGLSSRPGLLKRLFGKRAAS
jgi:acyl carrier protein